MGRAKLEMELISKEKSRNTTFKKRKEGLTRKLQEFTTLCDVKACMIIYGPTGATEPEIWPPNSDQVRRIIDIYKSKNKDSGIKSYGVADFFHEREKKIEEELAKMRKKNLEAKYPTMPHLLNEATEAQLREFNSLLSSKTDDVKLRIEFLRRKKQVAADGSLIDSRLMRNTQNQSHGSSRLDVSLTNHHHNQQPQQMINHNHPMEMQVPFIDPYQNPMMMLLMNDGASTSSNVQRQRQVFFESGPGPLLARYYAPPPQPFIMPAVGPPQLLFSSLDTVQEPGFIQYQVRNQTPGNQN